jgi:hypothetical protein
MSFGNRDREVNEANQRTSYSPLRALTTGLR